MKKKYINIPVFIPELACPFRCLYCNQRKITGFNTMPDETDINRIVGNYLTTAQSERTVEIAFFGGNFTGLSLEQQAQYLAMAGKFVKQGKVTGIRLSTRPDYISEEVLDLLARFPVTTLELGAQSMNEEVLLRCGRGHTAADTERASAMILRYGFRLGLQMMVGLPGDTPAGSLFTARRITELGASETRIYPLLVIRDTRLEKMYSGGEYIPLSLPEAVDQVKQLVPVFEKAGVTLLRIGLYPSEELLNGSALVAGPFHPSFRELVMTKIWNELLTPVMNLECRSAVRIHVPATEFNYAVGYSAENLNMLRTRFPKIIFHRDVNLHGRKFRIEQTERNL